MQQYVIPSPPRFPLEDIFNIYMITLNSQNFFYEYILLVKKQNFIDKVAFLFVDINARKK